MIRRVAAASLVAGALACALLAGAVLRVMLASWPYGHGGVGQVLALAAFGGLAVALGLAAHRLLRRPSAHLQSSTPR